MRLNTRGSEARLTKIRSECVLQLLAGSVKASDIAGPIDVDATATDTDFAPWHVVRSDDKQRARLNVIAHILDHVPYEKIKAPKVKLPKRQKKGDYQEPHYPYRYVAEKY